MLPSPYFVLLSRGGSHQAVDIHIQAALVAIRTTPQQPIITRIKRQANKVAERNAKEGVIQNNPHV